jgi:tetratricopeptide (TPR) repeat protein
VEERDAANLDATLTAALVRLLDVRTPPTTVTAQPDAAAYSRFVAARGYLRQYDSGDNLARATRELEAVTTSTPGYAPAQVALAEAYYRMYSNTKQREWLAKADQAVRRGAEIDQNEPGIPLMLGRILRATGQPDAAIRELQAALARDPGNLPELMLLAGAYQDAKRPAEAEAAYQQAVRLRPSYFPAYTNLGILYMSQGKWVAAEEPLTLVTKLAPDFADGYTSLGSLEYYLDHWDAAARLFSQSIRLKPTATAYYNRCGIDFYQKALDAAVADCRKAVELQPANPLGWGNLADALFERGNLEDAAQAYRRGLDEGNKLLAINPINPELMASMAKYAVRTGQKRRAIDLAAGALTQGNSVDVLYNTGKAYGLAGECARASGLLRQAFDKGYPRQVARRDPDLDRLQAAPLACTVPPLN